VSLLQQYEPPEAPADDRVERLLDDLVNAARAAMAAAGWTYVATQGPGTAWELRLERVPGADLAIPEGVEVRVWPVSLRAESSVQRVPRDAPQIQFVDVGAGELTTFLGCEVSAEREGRKQVTRFALVLPLVGGPAGRREAILRQILDDPQKVLRFLQFLLGEGVDDPMGGDGNPVEGTGVIGRGQQEEFVVLEALLRALAHDPNRLDEVHRLLQELGDGDEGRRRNPPWPPRGLASHLGRAPGGPGMSTDIPRPDVPEVLSHLKDFQRATAEYAFERLYNAPDPTHRFLVADEVGLGKTHVARGVIALAVDKLWETTRRIDVIYICSNGAIARQNINKLNVVPGNQEMNLASRITMLPVQVKDLGSRKLNFVSFTPATSFDLRSSLGMMDERAVLYRLLEKAWGVKGAAPKNALQGDAGTERFRGLIDSRYPAGSVDEGIAGQFAAALAARVAAGEATAGVPDIRTRWDQLCSFFARDAERRGRPAEALQLQVEVVGTLRDILATTCLQALEPDLIILDEFQRFKHLMDDASEESRLARDLFNYANDESRARVLLLSATPYKMFTGADEAGGEDHYEDFLATVRFLQNEPARTERCKTILAEFRRQMLRLQPGDGAPLRVLKDELEGELRRVMVRTERLAATPDRDGMLVQVGAAPLSVTSAEAVTYRGLGQIADALEQGDPIEYWKSAPFLLSFMEDYKLKQVFRNWRMTPRK
jgi:hypothetical protein